MGKDERLKVLLLGIDQIIKPWSEDVVTAMGDRHDLTVFDEDKSISEQFNDVDVVIDHGGHVSTHEMMEAATHARLWQIMSIGYEHFDIEYLNSKKMMVSHVPGTTSATSLAQTALMFILILAHRAKECEQNFKSGKWFEPCGCELEGKTLGILGLGSSGQRLASLVLPLGMKVIAANRSKIEDSALKHLSIMKIFPLDQLDTLIIESDFISLHLALTEETEEIIDARRIGLMKPTAHLINVARGGLVDESALHQALLSNKIGGAGLDVFTTEPPAVKDKVFSLPQVVVTPHIAGFTDGSSRKRAECIAENVDRVAQGLEPLHRIA